MTVAKLAGGVKRRKDMRRHCGSWLPIAFGDFVNLVGRTKLADNRLFVAPPSRTGSPTAGRMPGRHRTSHDVPESEAGGISLFRPLLNVGGIHLIPNAVGRHE